MAGRTRRSGDRGAGTEREREMRDLLAMAERSGLTLREVAEAAGVSASTLWWRRREIARRERARCAAGADAAQPAFRVSVRCTPSGAAAPRRDHGGHVEEASGRGVPPTAQSCSRVAQLRPSPATHATDATHATGS